MPRPGQKLHVFPLGDEAVVDSTTRGSVARLAVHSCRCSTGHTSTLVAAHCRTEGSVLTQVVAHFSTQPPLTLVVSRCSKRTSCGTPTVGKACADKSCITLQYTRLVTDTSCSTLQFTVDSLEFHWRTLVPLELELYLSSAGVPLENLRSAGAPGDAPGHCQAVPQPGMHVLVTKLMDETMSGK